MKDGKKRSAPVKVEEKPETLPKHHRKKRKQKLLLKNLRSYLLKLERRRKKEILPYFNLKIVQFIEMG